MLVTFTDTTSDHALSDRKDGSDHLLEPVTPAMSDALTMWSSTGVRASYSTFRDLPDPSF